MSTLNLSGVLAVLCLNASLLFHFKRSRDVAELHANMTFDPAKINLQKTQNQCEHKGRTSACVNILVCFEYKVKSDKKTIKSAGEK